MAVPIEFVRFASVVAGIAVSHQHTLASALGGASVIALFKILAPPFETGPGVDGFVLHLFGEWVVPANLLLPLVGFALPARRFEFSRIPAELPRFLPDDWKGGFVLLGIVFVLSAEGRSVVPWLRHGWSVVVASVAGFAVMLAALGFHPRTDTRHAPEPSYVTAIEEVQSR
jgi:hypothetical protein